MTTELTPWQNAIKVSETKFNEIVASSGTRVTYEMESMFALQAITGNDFLAKTANSNVNSLRDAIINISSIGLSLNPATAYAYLVPRDGKVCLDVSYKGLIKLATDTGVIKWVRAELVYEKDKFKYLGPAKQPDIDIDNVFGDRGKMIGAYCIAKTTDGDILTEIMNAAEIEEVKATSKAKNGPWKMWKKEMTRKAIIKRASKTWPRSGANERFSEAVHMINEHEGLENTGVNDNTPKVTAARFESWLDALVEAGKTIEEIEAAFAGKQRDLDELTGVEMKKVLGYKKDIFELMRENSAPPALISCPVGIEVVATDCEQCPKVATCEEIKKYKETK